MSRVARKYPQQISEAVQDFIRASKLSSGLNTHIIFEAWDQASGAGPFTLKKFFRDGKLYITLNSSVVCTQLQFQKKELIDKINQITSSNPIFVQGVDGKSTVKELILK